MKINYQFRMKFSDQYFWRMSTRLFILKPNIISHVYESSLEPFVLNVSMTTFSNEYVPTLYYYESTCV